MFKRKTLISDSVNVTSYSLTENCQIALLVSFSFSYKGT